MSFIHFAASCQNKLYANNFIPDKPSLLVLVFEDRILYLQTFQSRSGPTKRLALYKINSFGNGRYTRANPEVMNIVLKIPFSAMNLHNF